ncbi:MAG: hypothetical protein JNK02_07710 [Planctomycetes bacterium]|nr:hypothetical protein [Planctomycetota bacterium]
MTTLPRTGALLLATSGALFGQDPGSALLEPSEIRALVVRAAETELLATSRGIAAALDRAAELGFDAVVPLVFEPGRAWASSPALAAAGVEAQPAVPGRDLVGELVFEAHRAGLEVLIGLDGELVLGAGAAGRAALRSAAVELARAHEVDGFVLWNGLAAFPVEATRDPTLRTALAESAQELAAWRAELAALDGGLVVGWYAADARRAWPADLATLDFVVVPPGARDLPEHVAAWMRAGRGRAALALALDGALTPAAFAESLAAARTAPFAGEFLGPFAELEARGRALADVLDQGLDAPYYARAIPPWRAGVARRTPAPTAALFDDSGSFEKVEADPPYAVLAPGARGAASWALAADAPGEHELWLWLEPSAGPHGELELTIPVDPRRVQRIKLQAGEPRGWTRVGRAHLGSTRREDVLRLEVPAGGARGLAVGSVVALARKRPGPR